MTFFIEKPSKILQWLNTKGYSGTNEDAFMTYIQNGSPLASGTMEDHLVARLTSYGYTGTMNDMLTTMFQAITGVQNRADAERQFFQNANLDISSIPQAAGTAIGNMTQDGGVNAAFDNNTNYSAGVNTTGCYALNAASGYIGKDWGVGNTYTVKSFKIFAPVNNYFIETGATFDLTLEGSTDNFVGSIVSLYQENGIARSLGQVKTVSTGIDTSTAYRYHRIKLVELNSNNKLMAELYFYR